MLREIAETETNTIKLMKAASSALKNNDKNYAMILLSKIASIAELPDEQEAWMNVLRRNSNA